MSGTSEHKGSKIQPVRAVPGVMRTCTASPRAVLPSSAASALAQQQMLTPVVTSVSAQPAAAQLFRWRPRQRTIRSISVSYSLHDGGSSRQHTQGRSLSSHGSIHRGAAMVAATTSGSEASAPAAGGIATAAATLQPSVSEGEPPHSPGVRQVGMVAVVPDGGESPLGPSWQAVMTHISDRLSWVHPDFKLQVRTESQLMADPGVREAAGRAEVVLAVGVRAPRAVEALAGAAPPGAVELAFDCDPALESRSRLQGFKLSDPSLLQSLATSLPFGPAKKAAAAASSVQTFWRRASSDDLLYMFLTIINAYFAEVPMLQSMRAQDLGTIANMIRKCGPQIFACVNDPDCKAALDCLQACGPTDQVCSYRCIVTYESRMLEDFSLCILQKNNCLGMNAQIPQRPTVEPMTEFQGQQLTHELAERIFIGWLGRERWSWRVAAGQNAAYDQFNDQYQVYYLAKARGVMWYDPVFQVERLDGTRVWRRRHYRVRRGKVPGTFHLSVLDNGVVSKEFWRIVDCTDDLSWALFYYAGAASAAGQSYQGAVLVTPDGKWPGQEHRARLTDAFDAAGIKEWEMYRVSNRHPDGSGEPPLDLPPIARHPDPAGFGWG